MSTSFSFVRFSGNFILRPHRNLSLQRIQNLHLRQESTPTRYSAIFTQNQKPETKLVTSGLNGLQGLPTNAPKPDERTVKLGKTLSILQERLPSLLQKPLPQEILSPQITLHLFPSTHPHLPTVSGRVAYSAALWTSPIVWSCLPLTSNVKLEILSERMIRQPRTIVSSSEQTEQLVVRWSTVGKKQRESCSDFSSGGIGAKANVNKLMKWFEGEEFTGLFIFKFDTEGRIATHIIEHAQEGGNWENGVGAKVVALTDWLLGRMKGNLPPDDSAPCPAYWHGEFGKAPSRIVKQ
ncbi:hypothetical protein K3495_g12987 [Podosphaera aphanis]|nr:hypothetical protein K3495_g12987 [Podosphaera aphanis]